MAMLVEWPHKQGVILPMNTLVYIYINPQKGIGPYRQRVIATK